MSENDVKEITALQEQVKTLFNTVGELKNDIKELKEKLTNRVPPWVTIVIAALTAICGWLARN